MPPSSEQKKQFLNALLHAVAVHNSLNLQVCSVPRQVALLITAHGAYESGWGRAAAAALGFNYWNLTAGPFWKGPIVQGNDTEFVAGAKTTDKPRAIGQRFRKYLSPQEAVRDYLHFLSMPRYKDALAKLNKGDRTFVEDLGAYRYSTNGKTIVKAWPDGVVKGGFYTLPIERYTSEFYAVLKQVTSLAEQLD